MGNSLVFILLGLTTIVLLVGLFSMIKGGKFNKEHGNKLMFWRVGLQAATIGVIGILFLIK